MAKIVIIGAGPTGLSAAYHLEKRGFFNYKIFEKEETTGGLCRSVIQDGFTFDFTGHLLHVNDNYFKSIIENTVGLENLNNIHRRSYIYYKDIYTKYPFQVNLYGQSPEVIADCIEKYVTRKVKKTSPKNFHDWVLQSFGQGFGEHFFFPYQEKIFSYNTKKLSASWTGRFVPNTSLKDLISGAIRDSEDQIGYNSQFYYPKSGGINFWVNKIYEQLINPVYSGYEVKSINIKEKIVIFSNGHHEKYDQLITTMPLDSFIENSIEPSDMSLKTIKSKLLCNSVVNFNLGIKRENLSDKHWIYYPETKYPFYRIGFWHNFSNNMAPAGHSSLYGEFSHLNKSKKVVSQMLEHTRQEALKLFKISPDEIATEKVIYIKNAYVIYNHWRDNNLNNIFKRLEENNIYSVGRYGAWKYSSMQEAILDGKNVVDSLVLHENKTDEIMALEKIYIPKRQIETAQ